jgi:hypothetical protein
LPGLGQRVPGNRDRAHAPEHDRRQHPTRNSRQRFLSSVDARADSAVRAPVSRPTRSRGTRLASSLRRRQGRRAESTMSLNPVPRRQMCPVRRTRDMGPPPTSSLPHAVLMRSAAERRRVG